MKRGCNEKKGVFLASIKDQREEGVESWAWSAKQVWF